MVEDYDAKKMNPAREEREERGMGEKAKKLSDIMRGLAEKKFGFLSSLPFFFFHGIEDNLRPKQEKLRSTKETIKQRWCTFGDRLLLQLQIQLLNLRRRDNLLLVLPLPFLQILDSDSFRDHRSLVVTLRDRFDVS